MAFGLSAASAALLGSVAAPVIGGIMGGSSGGRSQGGTQTASRDPWAEAQPWMKQNLTTGQNLQNFYQTNPFNAQQQSAYSNLGSGADYLNRAVPSLLQQFSQPTGFNRNDPTARPSPINFSAPTVTPQAAQAFGGQMQASAPVQSDMNTASNPFAQDKMPAVVDPITQAYKDILNRSPDSGGLSYYTSQLSGGKSLDSIRAEMTGSAEARGMLNQQGPAQYGRNAFQGGDR